MNTTKLYAEMEAKYPGFIARTMVAKATKQAQLSCIPFSYHNAQGI